ncbi:hypothetical protein CAP48_11760 [Advenella sp. S44]|uniref:Spy/CpxP family protein refolding chaperone n=1 Tax=Advenella sp. S44 TaxID=1982755 RepID=UPI000C2AFF7E|nr:Spy/CpxP family protein refolding chaperone [Advenella sp. S44]PJX23755.1 hypothetical protein CAP48_11760 [Advenella sp. S44]
MAVQFSGSFLAKSLFAGALSAAVASTAFAQTLKPDTESTPISPSVQFENGSNGTMEHHRIEAKPQHRVKKHHKAEGQKHGRHHRGMRNAAIVIPGLGGGSQKLVDDLKLTEEQQTKLKAIKDERKEAHKPNREAFREYQQERSKQLESGNIDPKALLEAQKEMHADFAKKRTDDQAKWLGLWDTFSADQKATVVKYFKERSDKWKERRNKSGQERAKMKDAKQTQAADSTDSEAAADSTATEAEAPKQ